jgi:TolB-like protein
MKRAVSLILLAHLAVAPLAQEKPHNVYKGYSNPKKTNIAVTDFEGRGLQEGETHTLTDAFRSYLVNTGVFRVMERGQMDEIMKEQGFQQSGACTDQACMVEMGQLLGVEHIIAGSIGKVGGTYSVNARLISVRTGEIIKTVSKFHKGEIDGLLTETLPLVANEIAGIDRSAPRPVESIVPPLPEEEVKKRKNRKGPKVALLLSLGALAAGGGAAAYFLIQEKEDQAPTGAVEVSWE